MDSLDLLGLIFGGLFLLASIALLILHIIMGIATPTVLNKAQGSHRLVKLSPMDIEGVVTSCEKDHIIFKQVLLLGPMAPIKIRRKDIRYAIFC